MAGPTASMLLADFGADVVKVEPPEGESSRRWGSRALRRRGDMSGLLRRAQPQQGERHGRPEVASRARGGRARSPREADVVHRELQAGRRRPPRASATSSSRRGRPELVYCCGVGLRADRPAARAARLRPAAAGLRRAHEHHRRAGPPVGADRALGDRPDDRRARRLRHRARAARARPHGARAARRDLAVRLLAAPDHALHRRLHRLGAAARQARRRASPSSRPTACSAAATASSTSASAPTRCSRSCAPRSARPSSRATRASPTNGARLEHRDELAAALGAAVRAREDAAHWVAVCAPARASRRASSTTSPRSSRRSRRSRAR